MPAVPQAFAPFRLATVLLVVARAILAHADPVDDTARAVMAKRHIPALSLAVVDHGEIVKVQAYGMLGPEKPATPDTLFEAGSVSKPVATLGALLLVQSGRLNLDDDVNRTLRSWKVPENEFTTQQKVTLRRLLSHTAGLSGRSYNGYEMAEPVPTLRQLLDAQRPSQSVAVRVELVPGSRFRYTGSGFLVLQQLLIDVTGKPFPDYMRHAVFEPLGMARSTYQQPLPAAWRSDAAPGHVDPWKPLPNGSRIFPELAAAGLWTTPSDLARLMIAVQDAYTGTKATLLGTSPTREMLRRQMEQQGLGFELAGDGETLRFLHGGRVAGFDTQFVGYAGLGKGAVVMININDPSNAMSQVIDTVVDVYGWRDYPRLRAPKPVDDKEPKVAAQVRAILTAAAEGKAEKSLFTANAYSSFAGRLKAGLAGELKSHGAIQSIDLLGRTLRGDVQESRYRVTCERETLRVICAVYRGKEIGQLDLWVE